ncbi:peptidoglycan-binding domain-containing protein [Azospirillum halopraeferens]|uniref:peptidoglycan-binding domain-containing protein n=1 Tax=Azospirillum halopraeferens TaxID=34010 RepID=UPI000424783D|nr:peptidoglycan-binding domain-containing protein [Azospirillum halopraeferens]
MVRTVLAAILILIAGPSMAACDEAAMPPQMLTAYVVGVQEALAAQGFRPGPADGKPGARTRAAIRAYQKAAGLPVDGCVSQGLADHINFALPKVYGPGRR